VKITHKTIYYKRRYYRYSRILFYANNCNLLTQYCYIIVKKPKGKKQYIGRTTIGGGAAVVQIPQGRNLWPWPVPRQSSVVVRLGRSCKKAAHACRLESRDHRRVPRDQLRVYVAVATCGTIRFYTAYMLRLVTVRNIFHHFDRVNIF